MLRFVVVAAVFSGLFCTPYSRTEVRRRDFFVDSDRYPPDVDAAIASDPISRSQSPPSFRSPCGAMEDSFYLAIGRQLWDASLVTAPTLVVASERDFWSRSEDREHLVADLVHSPKVRVVVIPGASHFVHLDRSDRGRTELLDTIESFMEN